MDQQQAARAVLIEVINVLGSFKNEIVIVGGWVPELRYPGKNHIGSLDVDLAISPGAIRDDAYSTILGRLKENQYTHQIHPTRFFRTVPGAVEPVKVDLISGEYVLQQKSSSILVNELQLNCLRGLDLAFEAFDEIKIEGTMPDGSHNIVNARVVRPEAFLLIKAFALRDRKKEKDAYDIAFILNYYQPSLASLASQLIPLVQTGLGAEGWQILIEKFSRLESVGPAWAASLIEEGGQDREQAQQSAFQNAQELFQEVDRLQKA